MPPKLQSRFSQPRRTNEVEVLTRLIFWFHRKLRRRFFDGGGGFASDSWANCAKPRECEIIWFRTKCFHGYGMELEPIYIRTACEEKMQMRRVWPSFEVTYVRIRAKCDAYFGQYPRSGPFRSAVSNHAVNSFWFCVFMFSLRHLCRFGVGVA